MLSSLRVQVKKIFDSLVYRYAWLNYLLRNLNKKISFLTSFRLRPFGILHIRLASGLAFRMHTNETSTVTKKIFWNGADQYEYTQLFEKLATRSKVFFDIGSSIGYYALLAAKCNKELKAYAFEPASAPFHFLQKNVFLNKLDKQVELFSVALSNQQGQVEFFEFRNNNTNSLKYNLGGAGSLKINFDSQRLNTVPVQVPCDTLDEFCNRHKLPYPDLIKMDTEGTENMVLEGATKVLQTKPIIICETLFNTIEPQLDAILRSQGYEFYNFQEGRLIKIDSIIRDKDNGVRDCFFVHPSKKFLLKGLI